MTATARDPLIGAAVMFQLGPGRHYRSGRVSRAKDEGVYDVVETIEAWQRRRGELVLRTLKGRHYAVPLERIRRVS